MLKWLMAAICNVECWGFDCPAALCLCKYQTMTAVSQPAPDRKQNHAWWQCGRSGQQLLQASRFNQCCLLVQHLHCPSDVQCHVGDDSRVEKHCWDLRILVAEQRFLAAARRLPGKQNLVHPVLAVVAQQHRSKRHHVCRVGCKCTGACGCTSCIS